METSDMWQILPVWNKEASTNMSSQRKCESAIIQRNPISNRELVGVLPNHQWGHPPLATQDPLIDTESDDDLSSSVVATRKMAPVDNTTINNNSRMQMDDMVPYHKFSYRTHQQVHDKVREKHFALAKGHYQLVNELNHYKGLNLVQNSSIQGYQESSISAALTERPSRLAKIEPSIVTKVVSFSSRPRSFAVNM